MKFGLQKTTLLDYPGKVAAILFTTGCNLRCPYCHNGDLVFCDQGDYLIDRQEVSQFLKKRAPVLGGVVISGGEPLLHGDKLKDLITEIHDLGLKVKIDTNGFYPDKLSQLDVDFIAMDLKTSPSRYKEMGYGGNDAAGLLNQTAQYIITSKIDHQFRTTVQQEIVSSRDIDEMVSLLKGCNDHRLTAFRGGNTLDPLWQEKESPTLAYLTEIRDLFIKKGIPSHIA